MFTVAMTSRLLQTHTGRELISATVGEAFLFSPSRTVLPGQTPVERDLSPLVVEVAANLSDNWTITAAQHRDVDTGRSEEHTSELQSLMRISYAVFCLKKKN